MTRPSFFLTSRFSSTTILAAAERREARFRLKHQGSLPTMAPVSADIKALVDDPQSFLESYLLGIKFSQQIEETDQLVKLVPARDKSYDLVLAETASDDTISAYVLGYTNNKANDAKFLDIPSTGVKEGTLFFTSKLTGCSLVVTRLNADKYRVFHDYRTNSAILYDNVVMCVDFEDYKFAGQYSAGYAVACMQFRDGAWKLFVQQQYPNFLRVDVKDSVNTLSLHTSFQNNRGWMQQRIKDLAKALKVDPAIIDAAEDGIYQGTGEFDENDSSIIEWNNLRNAIQKELGDEYMKARAEIAKLKETDRKLWNTKSAKYEFLYVNYTGMVDDSKNLDKIWLWLQIKKATGSNGNQSEGGDDQEPPNYTISERYAEMERDLSSRSENAKFMEGYQNYVSIDIPHFNSTMTSSEMKELFVTTHDLSEEAQGALCRRISIASDQEPLMKLQEEIQNDFQSQSNGFIESAPQDFFLTNVGDTYGGRCYPLVRAMAVALSTGEEEAAKNFLDKLTEFSKDELTPSQQENAKYLRDALADLHANEEAHSASFPQPNVYGIAQIVDKLRSSKQTEVYALNTEEHSMLVGVTVSGEIRNYYFYDPNFLIAGFDSDSKLQLAMDHFFVNREFAKNYKAFSSAEEPEEPKFKLVSIDCDKMGEARVDGGISVRQISSGIDLGDIFDERVKSHVVGIAESYLVGDLSLRAALSVGEAYEWTARWREASIHLAQEGGLTENWAPLLDTLHESTDGSYKMQYINANNTEETRWVSTKDTTFKEFTSYLSTKWKALRKDFTFENGKFTAHAALEGYPIDGLNAMFVVQAIIDCLNRGASAPGESINAELSLAMKVHSYVNMIQIAHTTILDINKVADLVKIALKGEQLVGKVSLSTFSNVFKSTVTEGFRVLLGFVNVGLDAYELSLAQNEVEKATFGTQLAFDLASSVAGVAGLGAGLVGAAGVAVALSGAGVILGGLGIGIGALAQSFGKIASDAQQVGNYFAGVDEAYRGGGYKYETNEKALVPLPEAVVTSLKMADSEIEVGFDSQFIYRTHHGVTGSGKINYFFWAGDMPRMVKDRSQAINVREGIGYSQNRTRKLFGEAKYIILPVTPKSFISYDWMILPCATTRHDRGFDVIRRLEEDYRFDYDFYIFPSEYTINKIKFEYVETKISVVLDKRSIRLQMHPELPKELHGYLSYEVEGTGGEYCIGLAKGYSLSLKTSGSHAKETTWIIDGSTLGDDSTNVGRDFVNVGGITIHLLSQDIGRLLVISSVGEVSLVDLVSRQSSIQSIDASKWTVKNETLQHHLEKLAQQHRMSARFVLVNNYTAEEKGQKREVGRAYYDVSGNRMLYIDVEADIGCNIIDVSLSSDGHFGGDQPTRKVYTATNARDDAVITRDAFLGAVVGDDAYFFHTQKKRLWRVNAETHRITAKYYTSPQFEYSDIEISSVSQHGDFVVVAISPINQADKGVEEIMYHIHKDTMVLSSVIGNQVLFRRIYGRQGISLNELVGSGNSLPATTMFSPINLVVTGVKEFMYHMHKHTTMVSSVIGNQELITPIYGRQGISLNELVGSGNSLPATTMFSKFAHQTLVAASKAEFVTVLCKDESGDQFHCWLRTSDDALIQANLKPAPNDLILTASSHKLQGKDVFYFYSVREEAVYCQHGSGHAQDSQAKQIKVPGVTNLFSVHGEVFVTTKEGCISRLLVDGSLYLEAVNEHWLAQHPKWWLDLASLDGKKDTSMTVLGVRDTKNQVVPIWYQDGKIVIASSKLHGKQVQFFGLYGDDQAALLFDLESGLLYRQPLTSNVALDNMVNSEGKLIDNGSHKIPEAEAMFGGERLKEPAMVDGDLRITTERGIVLVLGGHTGMATLVAVDKAWQKSSHDLKVDLENLGKIWSHMDVVVLQGNSSDSIPAWYYFQSQEIVIAKYLKWSDHPIWVGKSIDVGKFYIYANDSLYAVDRASDKMTEKGRFTVAKVHGKSLVLQSTSPNAEINIPTVLGLDFAVVAATNANVVIDEQNLKHYKMIIVNNKMDRNGGQTVDINYSEENMLIQKMGNDMVFVDGSSGGSVNLANVLADEVEQGSYKVKVGLGTDKEEFMISRFHDYLAKLPLLEVEVGIFPFAEVIKLIK